MSTPNRTSVPTEPLLALMQMTTGKWVSQAIYVAAKLKVADLLKQGPKSYQDIAKSTNSHAMSLYRVLRALASIGIFTEIDKGSFALTPMAEYLCSDVPSSVRAWATMVGEEWHWNMWGEILLAVQSGKPSFDHVYNMRPFEFFAKNPEDGKLFDQAMTGFSAAEIAAVVESYDFSQFNRLVDVGGGHGSLLISVLKNNPGVKAILYDLPPVAEGAAEAMASESLNHRCEVLAGDFFESVPSGGDAYIMKHIIHDWNDEHALRILKNCHRAMASATKLLLIEMVIPSGNEPFFGKFLDLEMLLIGGSERTESEYAALFESAGFKLTRVVPTHSPVAVIEGIRL